MRISVPATSANLGPGFDCLGVALNLKNQVIIRPSKFHSVSLKGEGSNNPVLKKSNSSELYFEDDEIEKTEKIIEDNNFEFIHKIVEQPWKQRVLRFYDYDFNIIEIGEPLEHVA